MFEAMSITVDLAPEELAEIRQRTKVGDDQEAVRLAAREYLRMNRLRELKGISGEFDYSDRSDELEDLESTETHPTDQA